MYMPPLGKWPRALQKKNSCKRWPGRLRGNRPKVRVTNNRMSRESRQQRYRGYCRARCRCENKRTTKTQILHRNSEHQREMVTNDPYIKAMHHYKHNPLSYQQFQTYRQKLGVETDFMTSRAFYDAVVAYQNKYWLEPDGIIWPITSAHLDRSPVQNTHTNDTTDDRSDWPGTWAEAQQQERERAAEDERLRNEPAIDPFEHGYGEPAETGSTSSSESTSEQYISPTPSDLQQRARSAPFPTSSIPGYPLNSGSGSRFDSPSTPSSTPSISSNSWRGRFLQRVQRGRTGTSAPGPSTPTPSQPHTPAQAYQYPKANNPPPNTNRFPRPTTPPPIAKPFPKTPVARRTPTPPTRTQTTPAAPTQPSIIRTPITNTQPKASPPKTTSQIEQQRKQKEFEQKVQQAINIDQRKVPQLVQLLTSEIKSDPGYQKIPGKYRDKLQVSIQSIKKNGQKYEISWTMDCSQFPEKLSGPMVKIFTWQREIRLQDKVLSWIQSGLPAWISRASPHLSVQINKVWTVAHITIINNQPTIPISQQLNI